MNGWIKLYRKIMENPIVTKDADHLAIWVYLLLNATHDTYPVLFRGEKMYLEPGQLLTGRKAIAERLAISESKVQRVLDDFKSEHQIEQQTSNKNRLLSILNWDFYQGTEQQNERQMNGKRTTTEQQVNTNKNVKECKNEKNVRNNSKENTLQVLERLIVDFTISEPLVEKMQEWVTYKSERKQTYKETGLRTLLKQVATKEQEYGSVAVMDLIDDCMARNYSGIIWDRLKSTGTKKTDFVDMWRNA